jgi:hypothetical protein
MTATDARAYDLAEARRELYGRKRENAKLRSDRALHRTRETEIPGLGEAMAGESKS